MELKDGLYEQVINKIIDKKINEIDGNRKLIEKDKIDEEESQYVLSNYLAKVINKGLSYVNDDDKLNRRISICNNIIKYMISELGEESLSEFLISGDAQMLFAVLNKINSCEIIQKEKRNNRPLTPLSQSWLFTSSGKEPNLVSELKKEILTSDRIDMLVSFIKWSGIRLISEELSEFTKTKKLRIITTSYMGATDYKAIEFLSQLPNTEVKISYDTERTRLHAKAYLFHRDTEFSTAYIGSSNLSSSAVTSGLEWNIKISEQDSKDIMKKFEVTFDSYWHDKEFYSFDINQKDILKSALLRERNNGNGIVYNFDIEPYHYQKEILDNLKAERKIHNRYKNLVVLATGTGKTVISAFDYKDFCREKPTSNRLLFIAHREEILKQSLACFRAVLKNQNFGDLYVGGYEPEKLDHLFMSIQSFNSRELTRYTTPDFYDFIIIDEFHHTAAPSYQELLEYYKPKVLLGLTATPERMDGKDVFKYFDGRIAAEIRLYEAIERKLLSPFQYFGVSDSIDLGHLKWSRGSYDKAELDKVYSKNTQRAGEVIEALKKYVTDIKDVIGLGFCNSIEHSIFMSEFFNKRGISSIALNSESSKEERNSAQEKLRNKEINFIFIVDLYNEGVDIKEINTILFLRPTESLTIFLQQLGRGLRLCDGKECLTVLDFVGQANKKYNFEEKLRALLGRTRNSVEKEIENGFPNLPKGCFIQLERIAQKHILENIKAQINNRTSIRNRISTFTNDTGLELSIRNFIDHYHLDLKDIYSKAPWNRLCVEAGVRDEFYCEDEVKLTKALRRLNHINSRRWMLYILWQLENIEKIDEVYKDDEKLKMLTMFHYTIWGKPLKELGFNSLKESIFKLKDNYEMFEEAKEILKINLDKIDFIDESIDLGFTCPLYLHCKYTRDEILSALGYFKPDYFVPINAGVLYLEEKSIDVFFVTLNKTDKDYSPSTMYEDYAIDEFLFHWQSQSTTSDESKTGVRYINHSRLGSKIMLFVREYKKELDIAAPYVYLGTANYVSYEGSRPMNIIWRLDKEMPAKLVAQR